MKSRLLAEQGATHTVTRAASTPTTYSPSQLGRLAGLSPDTIRHYERLGILPAAVRTAAGYRRYEATAIDRIKLVQSALMLGFTLRELAEAFLVHHSGGAPCQRVFKMAEQKLLKTVAEISELRRTERSLRQVLKTWQKLMARATPGERAYLLHSLTPTIGPSRRGSVALTRRRSTSLG
ncbi:MAG: MerR family DNA-binding transcriptional regulator [Terriglobales bacterium]